MKSKKAAIEMSMGTIVVIVLSVVLLIFGLIFTKNIMCSGIILTNQIDEKATNQIKGLFGENDYGVICMGERGQEVKLGDDGRRQITCVINTKSQSEYKLTIKSVDSLIGTPTANVQSWIINKDWQGFVSPGGQTQTVLLLDVPQKVSDTSLKIELEEENVATQLKQTHTIFVDVVHVGSISSAIC